MANFYLHIDDKQISQLVKTTIRKADYRPVFYKDISNVSSNVIIVSDHDNCAKDFETRFHDTMNARLLLITDSKSTLSIPNMQVVGKSDFSFQCFMELLKPQIQFVQGEKSLQQGVRTFFKNFSGGDKAFFTEMMHFFEESLNLFILNFNKFKSADSSKEGFSAAHKFKSSLRSIGADCLVPQIETLEHLLTTKGFTAEADKLFDEITTKSQSLIEDLRA